ncbi:hypothetical protein [Entomospira culicis]|uniref:Uncharacterized protein n=1 Tax=Entomospira culicis TaxID=2719989 RepID=A0A968GDX3_9SPIO|nr:hypothetical protein [Entomospira culicis]NIZ18601.1 hypothetical protein [Entomospira culicis]NIZ68816.1 hypothetical protein [Entomospira culicis]WDI37412.1 hypothetical protein PVA46_01085 [Entomospira culicis]WDI39040.1 hypothetical protein PVA47_01090 [Entomospira culicis]
MEESHEKRVKGAPMAWLRYGMVWLANVALIYGLSSLVISSWDAFMPRWLGFFTVLVMGTAVVLGLLELALFQLLGFNPHPYPTYALSSTQRVINVKHYYIWSYALVILTLILFLLPLPLARWNSDGLEILFGYLFLTSLLGTWGYTPKKFLLIEYLAQKHGDIFTKKFKKLMMIYGILLFSPIIIGWALVWVWWINPILVATGWVALVTLFMPILSVYNTTRRQAQWFMEPNHELFLAWQEQRLAEVLASKGKK